MNLTLLRSQSVNSL